MLWGEAMSHKKSTGLKSAAIREKMPAMMGLSRGERLYLWRKRRGMIARDVVEHFGLSGGSRTVTDMERDRVPQEVIPELILEDGVQPWERCTILRRRAGWRIVDMAERMGLSHMTILAYERGDGGWENYVEWWSVRPSLRGDLEAPR